MHHDNRSAFFNGQVSDLLSQFLGEDTVTFHEVRVLFSQTDVFLLQQPPGQTAHFPFGAYVRAGAHDDIKSVFLCQSDKLRYVVIAREVELAFFLFVYVPKDIQAKRVHSQSFAHLDALLPIGTRDAGIMHFGGFDDERLAVKEECLVSYSESFGFGRGFCRSEKEQSGREQGCFKRVADTSV